MSLITAAFLLSVVLPAFADSPEIQEEAFRKGLIPYVPDDQPGDPAEE
jgi:hypothetical protein